MSNCVKDFMNRFCKLAVMLVMLQSLIFADSTTRNLGEQTMKVMKERYFCQKFLTYLYSDGKDFFWDIEGNKEAHYDEKAKAVILHNQFAYTFDFTESTSGKQDKNQKSIFENDIILMQGSQSHLW